MKPKMLVYAQYYAPEVASLAQLMTDLTESLSEQFEITVICSVPCYMGEIPPEYKGKRLHVDTHGSIRVIRVRVSPFDKTNKLSRIKSIITFFFGCVRATRLCGRQDIVFTTSNPPIIGGMLGVIGKRKTKGKLVFNVQDFCPEQMIAVHYMANPLLMKLMMKLDKRSCRRSDLMLLVGRDQAETLKKRFPKDTPKYEVINNWIDDEQIHPLPKDDPKVLAFRREHGLENQFVVMSSGNLGLFYDYDHLMEVIGKFKDRSDVTFAFVGDGAKKRDMMNYAEENVLLNVVFIPYQEKEKLIYSLNAADVHLIANARGIKGVSVPSKIYGVLAVNKPVLGILEKGSEAWRIIEESDCGYLCEAGDYAGIEAALRRVLDEKETFVRAHLTGRAYMETRFTRGKSMNAYAQTLLRLIGREGGGAR